MSGMVAASIQDLAANLPHDHFDELAGPVRLEIESPATTKSHVLSGEMIQRKFFRTRI